LNYLRLARFVLVVQKNEKRICGGSASKGAGLFDLRLAGGHAQCFCPAGLAGSECPVWSYENSTYNQTGVDIQVGGSLNASAGKNLVAQGVNANVGGSTSLRAGKDMQLTTALRGHVNTFDFYNKYKSAGDLLKISQRINSRDIDLQNSGNSWNSGGGVSLKAGGNLSVVGAQINSQGYSASAGGSYQERAAYDVKENVHIETTKRTGLGVYLADATNNTLGSIGSEILEKQNTPREILLLLVTGTLLAAPFALLLSAS